MTNIRCYLLFSCQYWPCSHPSLRSSPALTPPSPSRLACSQTGLSRSLSQILPAPALSCLKDTLRGVWVHLAVSLWHKKPIPDSTSEPFSDPGPGEAQPAWSVVRCWPASHHRPGCRNCGRGRQSGQPAPSAAWPEI